ncbi:MAG: translation elongation factor Ts [Proteobacteria bacterium]|nr:translation elongation factor Ts [Pseudomonadota bacterium]
MTVTSEMVRELREKTGAGMMDCKKALIDANGNMDKAIVWLREKGLASASKKSGRITKEGLVSSYIHSNGKIGVLVEVNCETDFVARNEKFQNMVKDIAMHVAAMNPRFLSADEISEDVKKAELEIYRKQAAESGKPANVIEKMVEGRFKKFCDEFCLLTQPFVKKPEQTIQEYVKENISVLGENMSVRRFIRWQLGE